MLRSPWIRSSLLIALVTIVFPARLAPAGPASADAEVAKGLSIYREALLLTKKAEELRTAGKREDALALYRNLMDKLEFFKNNNPRWNNSVTRHHIELCRRRIGELEMGIGKAAGRTTMVVMPEGEAGRAAESAAGKAQEAASGTGEGGTAAPVAEAREAPAQALPKLAPLQEALDRMREGDRRRRPERPAPPLQGPAVQRGSDSAPDTASAIERARALIAMGKADAALDLLRSAQASQPERADICRERARLYLSRGMYEPAAEDFGKLIAFGEADIDSYYGLGTACEKWAEKLESSGKAKEASEKYRDAIAAFKQVVWRQHAYAPAYYSLGCVYARLSRRDDAIYYFRKAVETSGAGSDLARRAAYNIQLLGGY